jgi:hypothetical protein
MYTLSLSVGFIRQMCFAGETTLPAAQSHHCRSDEAPFPELCTKAIEMIDFMAVGQFAAFIMSP